MAIIQPYDDGFTVWRGFARRHRGNPALERDPIYALPEPLIDAVKAQIPDFFSVEEEAFERDLVTTARGGFFLRRPFDCLLLAGPPEQPQLGLEAEIRAAQAELMADAGVNPHRIKEYFAANEREQADVAERRLAYCGWLVKWEQFREERGALRAYGKTLVAIEGGFPSLPRSFLGERPGPTDPGHLPFFSFYRRWGLDRMITWDLPSPLEPELTGALTHDWVSLGEAGLSLFVPWYLLRDRNVRLDQLVESLTTYRNPAHLRGWLEPKTSGKNQLGYIRLGNLMKLYRFRRLALADRYQLSGNTERLDKAFAEYLGFDTAQSVRKLRLAAKGLAGD